MEKNFKVYKSSAGSGKTFTLVKEFLKLCLKSNDVFGFARILAITFTNKATFEMKERIMRALKELSLDLPSAQLLKSILLEETSLTAEDLKHKAHQILTAILHNYADFGISTIDRFTHRVIRTFSKDLELSPVFRVELDEKALLIEVIDELVDAIGRDEELTELILKFTFFRMDEEKAWKVDRELLEFAQRILQERAMPYLSELRKLDSTDFEKALSQYDELTSTFEKELVRIGDVSSALIKQHGIQKESFAGNSKLSVYFENLAKGELTKITPSNQLQGNIDKGNWYAGKCAADQKGAIDAIKEDLLKYFNEIQELRETKYAEYITASEIKKTIHSLSLLNQIERKLSAYKKQEKVLNISDFNRIIADVVIHEPMPFIYERLGDRYRHIMIDEFQDTSVLQFTNLLPLVEDALAKGHENLIVGDAKQAIYRFRGGEVEQFAEMPDYVPHYTEDSDIYQERMLSLKRQYNENTLNYNFRSSVEVVQFNNDFFTYVKNWPNVSPKIKSIFNQHEQLLLSDKKRGYVEISFSTGKGKQEKRDAFEAKVLQSIQESIADGYSLKDIAILFRKKEHAENMASFLTEAKLSIISSEALKLENDMEVNFLINLSKWIYFPEIHLVQKELIEYFFYREQLTGSLDENLEKYTRSATGISKLFESVGIVFSAEAIKLKSLHEFYESLIRTFSLNEVYSLYIQTFQDTVLDFAKTIKGTIPQFLEWWEEHKAEVALDIPDELDAITLMTIHKSKGLEFPIVIFPYADQKIEYSGAMRKDYLWTKTPENETQPLPYALVEFTKRLADSQLNEVYREELEKKQIDLINVVYVAFTRAVDRLYIHTEESTRKSSELNLPDLLKGFVNANQLEEREGRFCIGNAIKKEDTDAVAVSSEDPDTIHLEYLSRPWNSKIRISESAHREWEQGEQVQYGILLHEVLGAIHDKKEVEAVLENYVLDGVLSKEQAADFQSKINSLLNKPFIELYFNKSNACRREASILSNEGKLLRPDRVVYLNDKVVVIDYKTGEKNEAHHQQVNKYIHALKGTTNQPVEGCILYTETEELVRV